MTLYSPSVHSVALYLEAQAKYKAMGYSVTNPCKEGMDEKEVFDLVKLYLSKTDVVQLLSDMPDTAPYRAFRNDCMKRCIIVRRHNQQI